jgi:hypothetical protein
MSIDRSVSRRPPFGWTSGLISFIVIICLWNASSAFGRTVPQGMFDSCDINQDLQQCTQRLERLGRAGFALSINGGGIDPDSPSATVAYAAAGSQVGIRQVWVIGADWWSNYDPAGTNQLGRYPAWTAACGCQTNDQLLVFIVSQLRGPATAGYYIADDSALYGHETALLPGLTALNQRLQQLDPAARTFLSNYQLSGPQGREVARYQQVADVVLQESYPVGGGPVDLGLLRQEVTWRSRAMANGRRSGLQSGAILQAWSWSESLYDTSPALFASGNTRFPRRAELRVLRNVTMRYHPQVIFWFTNTQVSGWPDGQELPYWRDIDPTVAARRWHRLRSVAFGAN